MEDRPEEFEKQSNNSTTEKELDEKSRQADIAQTLSQKLSLHSFEQDQPSEKHQAPSDLDSETPVRNGHHPRKTSDQKHETDDEIEWSALRSLKGVVAFITGGASGLGEAVVKLLVKRGAKVAIYDLNVAGEKLAGSLGDNCIFLQGDVCDSETLATSIEKTETSFGAYITLNVNCAGTATSRLLFDQNSDKIHCEKSFDRVMKTNVYGTFNVMRHLSKAMAKNKGTIEEGNGGLIINTGSISAFEGSAGQVAYSASKGAVESMTLPAARDLANLGIRVVTIAPGFFNTPLLNQAPEQMVTQIARTIPLCPKRLGQAAEFAHIVQCLYENPMINGTVIRMDAGGRMPPYVFPPSTRTT